MTCTKIKKLSRLEKRNIKGLIKKHKRYLKNTQKSTTDIKNDFQSVVKNTILKKSLELSDFLKKLSPHNFSKNQLNMIEFFKCAEVKNNHYVQEALINKILINKNDFKYINYAQYLNHFHNLAKKTSSNKSKILNDLKKIPPEGIDDYANSFVANYIKNQNNIYDVKNNPRTYFISVFTENMIETNNIEDAFMKSLDNKNLSRYNIIKYLSLHYSRNSYHFLSTIRCFSRFYNMDCNSIDF